MDNIHTNGVANIIDGISKVASVIRKTYGSAGSNVVLEEHLYPYQSVRNDGKAIMDKIKLVDPVENMGANIMRELADKADKDSADGRKTTMILADAIFQEAKGIDAQPMAIKRSLDEALEVVLKSLEEQKRDIGVDDIKAVAILSSESEEIGTLLQEIYQQIGKDGIVEVETSGLPKTFYELSEGVRIRGARMLGQYSNTEPGKAVFKDPTILISRDKITSVEQLEPIFGALAESGKNALVIYCEEIDMSVASRLALTHLQGGFKTLIIQSPTMWKDWFFEDFSKITGASIVDSREGKTFKNLTMADLGTCEKLITTSTETRVIGIKDITEHLAYLDEKIKIDENIKLRKHWLQTKVAILKMGGNSESELSYILKKAKDACSASYHALQGGVVAGGGVAFITASKILPDTVGGKILKQALLAPTKQIGANAGQLDLYVEGADFESGHGYDAKQDRFVDVWEVGIIDPTIVVSNAIRNAVSVAGIVLTSGCAITLPREKKEGNTNPYENL